MDVYALNLATERQKRTTMEHSRAAAFVLSTKAKLVFQVRTTRRVVVPIFVNLTVLMVAALDFAQRLVKRASNRREDVLARHPFFVASKLSRSASFQGLHFQLVVTVTAKFKPSSLSGLVMYLFKSLGRLLTLRVVSSNPVNCSRSPTSVETTTRSSLCKVPVLVYVQICLFVCGVVADVCRKCLECTSLHRSNEDSSISILLGYEYLPHFLQ